MSQENESLVRQAYEAYARGDTTRLLELVHSDLEWTYLDPADADPQPQVCHGRQELEQALGGQAGRGLKSQAEEIVSSGDMVMVVARTPGADRHRAWQNGDLNILVLTLAEGLVVAMRDFRDRGQARRFAHLD